MTSNSGGVQPWPWQLQPVHVGSPIIAQHYPGDPKHCHACALEVIRSLEDRIAVLVAEIDTLRASTPPTPIEAGDAPK